MATIPVKVIDRMKDNLNKLQKVIEQAKNRDINEADTVVIVTDILVNIFGYDKYTEITREYVVKSTFCDLAIKIESDLKFLIEVKAIGITLTDRHYEQVLNYGANNGCEWIILTNGLVWKIYKVKFEKPIKTDLVCEFSFLDLKMKNQNDLDKVFILCKEGLKKNAIDEFTQHRMVVNKYYIGSILQSGFVIEIIKRELKKINPLLKVEDEEVLGLLNNEILKRELLDSPDAIESNEKYLKVIKKLEKMKTKAKELSNGIKKEETANEIAVNIEDESKAAENIDK